MRCIGNTVIDDNGYWQGEKDVPFLNTIRRQFYFHAERSFMFYITIKLILEN